MTSYTTVKLTTDGAIATVTLNRPEVLNAMDAQSGYELNLCLDVIERDPQIEIIVFRGAGKAFSAGGNIEDEYSMPGVSQDGWTHAEKHTHAVGYYLRLMERIETSARTVIGVIHGPTVGGAFELVLSFDILIIAEEASIGDAHIRAGHTTGMGGAQRLARLVGAYRAKELVMTGRMLKGREAYAMGLASHCVPLAQLDATLKELTDRLTGNSFDVRRTMKRIINEGLRGTLDSGIKLEIATGGLYAVTAPDAIEGFQALREKRKPVWQPAGRFLKRS